MPPARESLVPDPMMKKAIEAAQSKKAEDLLILNVSGIAAFTDYFILMTAQTARQAQAISEEITVTLKKEKVKPLHEEGRIQGTWILLDYVDFVIHIFQPETRDFYALERLWGDAPDVTEHFLT